MQASLLPKHSPKLNSCPLQVFSSEKKLYLYLSVVTCYCDHRQCHHLYQYQYHYNYKITATVVFVMCTHVNIRMYLSMCQGNSANTLSQNHILNPEKKYSKTKTNLSSYSWTAPRATSLNFRMASFTSLMRKLRSCKISCAKLRKRSKCGNLAEIQTRRS